MLFLPFCIVMRIIVHHVLSCYCKDFSGLSEILIKILLSYLLSLVQHLQPVIRLGLFPNIIIGDRIDVHPKTVTVDA